ncbi:hypothetical protein HYV80_02535 [Candidatus Woesearchaeota archaeon]|nr:hypothetical protein [Candidatus Woesearchaeota archaeon]
MKIYTLIFALFFVLPLVYAETKIFSGKVITDNDKVIDGGVFRFKYDETSKKAFVQTPAGSLIVDNGACKPNNVFRVCINSANFTDKNVTTYVYYYEIDADIYKLTGSMAAGSKAASASLLQNEPTELTVTLTNPTDFDITNIDFSYDLQNFSAIDAKGCELNTNKLKWKGAIQPKYDKVCTAKIFADKHGTYILSGNFTYFNGFETEKKTTDSLAITVLPKQLRANQLIDNNTGIKAPFYLNLSLQNLHSSEEIAGTSTVALPSHVSLIKELPTFEKDAKVLKRSLILKPRDTINYSLYLEKLSAGKEPIIYKFEYTIKGINEEIENTIFIDVIGDEPAKIIEAKQEKPNETAANIAAIQGVQTPQIAAENKTGEAMLEPANKTAQQAVTAGFEAPKKSNRNLIILGTAGFAAFLIVVITIFKIRKGKIKKK